MKFVYKIILSSNLILNILIANITSVSHNTIVFSDFTESDLNYGYKTANFTILSPLTISLDDDNIAVEHNIRMSAHSLDTSFQCKRRHWLEQVKGWSPEPIYLINSESNLVEQESVFVSPTLFGTIVHRLLEIGLKNPSKVNGPPVMTLPSSWQNENDNLLKDEKY